MNSQSTLETLKRKNARIVLFLIINTVPPLVFIVQSLIPLMTHHIAIRVNWMNNSFLNKVILLLMCALASLMTMGGRISDLHQHELAKWEIFKEQQIN